jgi:hypothetical protein
MILLMEVRRVFCGVGVPNFIFSRYEDRLPVEFEILTVETMSTMFWAVTLKFIESPTFRRNIFNPSSGLKSKPKKKPVEASGKLSRVWAYGL